MSYRNRDLEKQKICAKRHYQKNKEKMKKRAIDWKQQNKIICQKYVLDYLKLHPCIDCGNSNPVVLEFDHRNPDEKSIAVSEACFGSFGLETVQKEVSKCDVRCANCHRIKTYIQFGRKHRS